MKGIIKPTIAFTLKLFLVLLFAFAIHETVYYSKEIAFDSFLIIESYCTNFFLVVFTFPLLLFVKQKNNQAVGFSFLGGFFLKLIPFLLFFNPVYKADQLIEPLEFLAFFTPYSICLTFETLMLVRLLNRS